MRRLAAGLVVVTLAGLGYVGAQVEAVKIGYTIRKQDERKTQFLDRARALKYNIARLKAPQNLEKRLLAERIVLEPPRSWQTLVMGEGQEAAKPLAGWLLGNQTAFLPKWFIGTAQAEAKEPPTG